MKKKTIYNIIDLLEEWRILIIVNFTISAEISPTIKTTSSKYCNMYHNCVSIDNIRNYLTLFLFTIKMPNALNKRCSVGHSWNFTRKNVYNRAINNFWLQTFELKSTTLKIYYCYSCHFSSVNQRWHKYLMINKKTPQKHIDTASTKKMFDNSATDTNIAVIVYYRRAVPPCTPTHTHNDTPPELTSLFEQISCQSRHRRRRRIIRRYP